MDAKQIATAVKLYLINLAINDKLPLDMNELNNDDALTEVIQKSLDEQAPTQEEKYLDKAGELLSFDTHEELVAMIKAIADNEDENEIIDYVEGVTVWEKVQFSFTCEQFLEYIDYVE